MIGKMQEIIQKKLTQAPENRVLQEHEWTAIPKPGTQDWSGQLRVRVSCTDELKILHGKLHGSPIWTGASWRHIAVNNPLLPAWRTAARQGGDAGRASGPPGRR